MTLATTACGTMLARTLAPHPVYAGDESRDRVLGGAGTGVLLFALVLLAAVGAFAAGILWRERQDGDTPDSEQLY